ncbi:hypothetical protein [Chryseobacterium sp. S90]|uniref:hypothetical protein n=1 Tax=Chryseobacterium sp. S90 TaxID=3395373 RepID=UPI0039BC837E
MALAGYIFCDNIRGNGGALYFKKIYAKTFFTGISNNFIRVNLGAITFGIFIFFLPDFDC